jgi:hypothetical protein
MFSVIRVTALTDTVDFIFTITQCARGGFCLPNLGVFYPTFKQQIGNCVVGTHIRFGKMIKMGITDVP